jgi:hypothetical protein
VSFGKLYCTAVDTYFKDFKSINIKNSNNEFSARSFARKLLVDDGNNPVEKSFINGFG